MSLAISKLHVEGVGAIYVKTDERYSSRYGDKERFASAYYKANHAG